MEKNEFSWFDFDQKTGLWPVDVARNIQFQALLWRETAKANLLQDQNPIKNHISEYAQWECEPSHLCNQTSKCF